MAQFNPYAAPSTDAEERGHRPVLDEDRVVTSEVLEALLQTRSWVQMLGVLGFIACGLAGAGGLLVIVLSSQRGNDIPAWMGVLGIVTAVLYTFPCVALLRYGRSIGDLNRGGGVHALVDALRHQKSFWRYFGIVSIAFIVALSLGASAVSNYLNFVQIMR